jgi:hypothetical protein
MNFVMCIADLKPNGFMLILRRAGEPARNNDAPSKEKLISHSRR